MWLVLGKIFYDSSCAFRALFWIIIGCAFISAVYEMYGWWGIAALLLFFIVSVGPIFYKSRSENDILTQEELKQPWEPQIKRKLTQEFVVSEQQKILQKHPDAVGDIKYYPSKYIYRIHWLKTENENKSNNVLEKDVLKAHFAISKDLYGIMATITNVGDEMIEIEWDSFRINKKRVFIDNESYISYDKSGKLMPGESVSILLQSVEFRKNNKFERMFDLRELSLERFVYHITYEAKVLNTKRKFGYNVCSQLKLIY